MLVLNGNDGMEDGQEAFEELRVFYKMIFFLKNFDMRKV